MDIIAEIANVGTIFSFARADWSFWLVSVGKRPALPLILSANALLEGEVVYRTADGGWSPHLGQARVAEDEAGAEALESALDAAELSGEVVEPELVPVTRDGAGRIVPTHYREKIRALGPTVRPDFGPQADGGEPSCIAMTSSIAASCASGSRSSATRSRAGSTAR